MTARSIDATWYRRPPDARDRRGAGGVVVSRHGGQLLVALIRGDGLPDYLLPKGGVEADESDEQAARREIEEEAGQTDLVFVADLGARERLSYDRDRWQVTHYFLFRANEIGGLATDTTHAYRTEWFPIDDLPQMFWPEQRSLIEDNLVAIMDMFNS